MNNVLWRLIFNHRDRRSVTAQSQSSTCIESIIDGYVAVKLSNRPPLVDTEHAYISNTCIPREPPRHLAKVDDTLLTPQPSTGAIRW